MNTPIPSLLLLFFCSFVLSCTPHDPQPEPILSSSTQVGFYTNAALKKLVTSNDSLTYKPADYEVTVHRIVYKTTLEDGVQVTASGVVFVPKQLTPAVKPYPLLSYQHGTAFSNADALSSGNLAIASFSYPLLYATYGYIVACPDYIGYGEARRQLPHRYQHRQTLAQATVDMLLATKEFLAKEGIKSSTQTFLTGYSEGGYASLAAQKLIEEKYADKISLAGSSCGAGPYAMSAFFDYVTHKPTIGGVANHIYAWQTLSYNSTYNVNKPISYYFKSPYAEQIGLSLDNARKITVSFDKICTDAFRAEVQDGTSAFGKALADNDLVDWSTQVPTRLIHSQQDEIIPYLATQQVYAGLTKRGSKKLNLVSFKTGYHVPIDVISLRRSLEWFQSLRE
ncbi:prolyl oligopeptidase family serine peptidase [Fibrella sp. HMF5335]|uniref:Prolyl oligopeptidase family serine peptidase n=1 Tax=Fibrella rubiginis TaxID=2817060 RepID=A0A939K1U6_9BACT|nr:lipase family protein [Fibrella rubiginis]MBO0937522.1 prolyl oligopeptidase family serine peptidase [Fibrella rubiginis]